MPILFPEITKYKINYDILLDDLIKHSETKLFDNKLIRMNYFETWLNYLKNADYRIISELNNYPALKSDYKKFYFTNEVFQQPHHYEFQTIYTHYNVGVLSNQMPKNPLEIATYVETNEFTKNNSQFHWNPIDHFFPLFPEKQEPILTVPFLEGSSNYLVIDGNSRLTKWIHTKSKIPVLFTDPNILINIESFCSDFDKIHYIFRYDMIHLSNLYTKTKITDTDLLNKSYLKNETLDF